MSVLMPRRLPYQLCVDEGVFLMQRCIVEISLYFLGLGHFFEARAYLSDQASISEPAQNMSLRTDRKPQVDFGVISTCKSRISELPMLSPDSELRQSVCKSVHHNQSLCSASQQECDAVCIYLVSC